MGSEVGQATCPERAAGAGRWQGRIGWGEGPVLWAESGVAGTSLQLGAEWEGAREAQSPAATAWHGQRSAPASSGSGGKTQSQGCRDHMALIMAQDLARAMAH